MRPAVSTAGVGLRLWCHSTVPYLGTEAVRGVVPDAEHAVGRARSMRWGGHGACGGAGAGQESAVVGKLVHGWDYYVTVYKGTGRPRC